jgi:hypothetical protein
MTDLSMLDPVGTIVVRRSTVAGGAGFPLGDVGVPQGPVVVVDVAGEELGSGVAGSVTVLLPALGAIELAQQIIECARAALAGGPPP